MEPMLIPCAEPDCNEKVVYIPDPIPGNLRVMATKEMPGEDVVYLACPKGHMHAYKVPKREG